MSNQEGANRKGPEDFATELEYYRYVARKMQADTDDMLEQLRQLQAVEGLSAKDQKAVAQQIAGYEKLQRTWKMRRTQLGDPDE